MKLMMLAALLLGESQDKKIQVVATLTTEGYIAERIGGKRVIVKSLASPLRDPHYIPADPIRQRIAGEADLFIYHGRGLDSWYRDVLQSAGNPRIQAGKALCQATKGCSVMELPKVVSKEYGDIHPEGNPHVHLDPANVQVMARNICDALLAVDPDGKAEYEANLKAFLNEIDVAMFGKELVEDEGAELLWRKLTLGKLDAYLKEEGDEAKLGGWLRKARAIKGVKFVSYHKTYIYFAERFGFEIAGEIEEKPGIAPPAKHLEEVIDLIKRNGIKIILNDSFYPTTASDYVASKSGARVCVVPHDVGGVEGADSYVKLIDFILDKMLAAMK